MAKKKAARRKSDPFPEDALKDLERSLKSDALPSIVILRGEERYFRDRGVDLAVAAAKEAGLDLCRHDALDPEYAVARLLDDLVTGALFAGARCVVLHSAERVVVDRASKASAPVREAMLARLETKAEGMLVLSAEKLRADHALVKAAAAAGGKVVGCRRLWDSPPAWDPDPRKAELVQWTAARARALGVKLDLSEAAFVAAATGNDLSAIEDQLQRLVGRGAEAIAELVAWDASASPWEVAEHIACGDVRRAAAGVETLFAGGASQRDGSRTIDTAGIAAQLCTALSAKLREAVRGAEVLASGGTPAAAAQAAGVKGPKAAVESFQKRMQSRPPAAWRPALDAFCAVERKTRSTVTVDATDFVHLALHLRRRRASGPSQSGAQRPRIAR
ncbi:MAG: hypothetical protein AAFU73_13955 [Planctomycetota bacterium]